MRVPIDFVTPEDDRRAGHDSAGIPEMAHPQAPETKVIPSLKPSDDFRSSHQNQLKLQVFNEAESRSDTDLPLFDVCWLTKTLLQQPPADQRSPPASEDIVALDDPRARSYSQPRHGTLPSQITSLPISLLFTAESPSAERHGTERPERLDAAAMTESHSWRDPDRCSCSVLLRRS